MTIHDQMAIQMADLGVDTRDTVYAPDADAAGNERFTTPAAQAAVANAARKHRSQAMASGDARTQGWNTASNFTDVGEQGLTNYFDGQGYRTQGGQAGRNRTVPRTAAQNKAFASRGRRAPGPSPLGGTIYYGPGTHESRGQAHDALYTPPAPRSQTGGSRRRHRGPQRSDIFPARSDHSNSSGSAALEQLAQQQIDALVAAAKAGTMENMMLRAQNELPKVAGLKVIITDNAIIHSNPLEAVLKKPAEWLFIFHATREWLVKLSFRLASFGNTQGRINGFETLKNQVSPLYVDTLYQDVIKAKEDVKQPHPGLEKEYREAGKLDVLEMAFELRRAETAQNVETINTTRVDAPQVPAAPTRQVAAPIHQVAAPVHQVRPVHQNAPVPQVAAPVHQVFTPVQQVNAPIRQVRPVHQNAAPVQQVNAPVHQVRPVHQNAPVPQVTAPVEQAGLPPRQRAPARQVPSLVQDVTPGLAELHFFVNGLRQVPLSTHLPPGLGVSVQMSINTDSDDLQDPELYLQAFNDLVETFYRRINRGDYRAANRAVDEDDVNSVSSTRAATGMSDSSDDEGGNTYYY